MQTLTNAAHTETSHEGESAKTLPEHCFQSVVPGYALLFFDHLYSEYLTLRFKINQPLLDLLDQIHEKRLRCQLRWSDIYTFGLALIEERPLENLIRKAYDARAKYRSIAGQKEFDEYLASKPPDLTSILIAPNPQPSETDESNALGRSSTPEEPPEPLPQSSEIIQRVLRADIRYLLSKFYLYYAMLPMRENLREDLTARAVAMTKWILVIIIALIIASFGGALVLDRFTKFDLRGAFGLTVGSVAFAGIVGGCVSMLQRIQSTPSEGDALFNLASLTNGWRGLSLSPLYGGIFASLLFILFAAGVLEGSIFPKINTPGKLLPPATVAQPANTTTPAAASEQPAQSQTPQQPVATPTPASETQKQGILQITEFLKQTGPTDGVAFALLIVWSFIAGFAERLVPDTLNRMVAKNEAIQGTNT